MKQLLVYISVLFFVIVMLFLPFQRDPKVEFSTLKQAALHHPKSWKKQDSVTLRKNFHIVQTEYKEFIYYQSGGAMEVDELLIVECDDSSKLDVILKKMEDRIEKQKQKFKGYGQKQYDLLEHATLTVFQNYCILIVSDQKDLLDLGGLL